MTGLNGPRLGANYTAETSLWKRPSPCIPSVQLHPGLGPRENPPQMNNGYAGSFRLPCSPCWKSPISWFFILPPKIDLADEEEMVNHHSLTEPLNSSRQTLPPPPPLHQWPERSNQPGDLHSRRVSAQNQNITTESAVNLFPLLFPHSYQASKRFLCTNVHNQNPLYDIPEMSFPLWYYQPVWSWTYFTACSSSFPFVHTTPITPCYYPSS